MSPSTIGAPAASVELRREQAEVGIVAARRAGGVFAAASALHLLALPPDRLLPVLPGLILLTVSAVLQLAGRRAGTSGARAVVVGTVLDLAALAAFLGPDVDASLRTVLSAITMLASMALPAGLLALGSSTRLPAIAVVSAVPVVVLAASATEESGRAAFVVLSVLVCWSIAVVGARWLAGSVARADAGTARLRTADETQRRSSGSEASRRRDARLMHDTVLATLTVVAHRGEGVPAATLRSQAASDLQVLRRLREGRDEPQERSTPVAPLPEAFVEVGRHHAARGLEVVWHGELAVDLPCGSLDALARATSECLENVRRHSGVRVVDVTLAHDEEAARVAVSDDGIGFDPESVPAERLGLAQSVIGRLDALGGGTRIFSAPGAGTTVLMSVPR